MGGQSSTGAGLKLQRPLTFSKAQFSHSASTVSQMRFICLSTDYDAVLCKGCFCIAAWCTICWLLPQISCFCIAACCTSCWLYCDFSNYENPGDHYKHMKDTVLYIYMNVLISAIKKYPKIFQINTMLIKLLVIRSLHTVLHIISSPIAMYITHIR